MKRIVNEFENKIKEIESALEYLKKDKSNPSNPSNQSLSNLINLRKSLNFSQQQISDKLGVIRQTVSYRELNGASSVNSGKYHTALLELCDDALKVKNDVETLKKLAYGDVLWAKITGIENIPNDGVEWVYDVTVEPNQTFISGNMVLHNTISVAKAGIIAKFRANTSILAAANPKFSRFDPYKSLVDQFDIPPTLLSRFDLIFPIRDVLDREQDRKIAQHILKMHKGDKELDEIKPKIERELFKKYIAYCRVNVHPVLSDDAADKIEEYYVTLRSSGVQGRVPATARQLEALVRLSESSAKTRLSNAVTVSDVERAIQLTNFIMKELATDETGAIDIDRIMTEHPKTDRDKIYAVENIVRVICQEREDKLAPIEEIMEKAEESKIDKGTANKILNELKIKGILFEPRNDKWKWVG